MLDDTASDRSWHAAHPTDAAEIFAASTAPWWIAGGWALDLFCGAPGRPHADLDVGLLRRDVSTVLRAFSGWDVLEARDGRLTRLDAGCAPSLDVHSLWCRPTAADRWTIELMLDEADGDAWIYRREPAIRRPIATIVCQSPDGLPYLAPEIQLLYKSKVPRGRDDGDFARTWPLIDPHGRQWLRDALELASPDHRWLAALRAAAADPTSARPSA